MVTPVPPADSVLAEAVREGWVTPPALVTTRQPARKPVMTLRDLLIDIERERAE